MSDLIDRQAAIDEVVAWLKDCMSDKKNGKPLTERLKDLPSAQPERKRGHWIEADDYYNQISGRCSVCGWESHMYEDDVAGMDFCPNCGADVRGEQDDSV